MPILTHETIVDVAKTASDRILERYKVIADEENDWEFCYCNRIIGILRK